MGAERMKLNCTMLEAVGYGMLMNGVPLLRSLTVSSGYVNDLAGLRLEIDGEPGFLQPVSLNFSLASGQTVDLAAEAAVRLVPSFFVGLTERVTAGVTIRVFDSTREIVRLAKTVELLPFDAWQGSLIMPETISAFVMPNQPALSKIVARAGKIVGKWTGDSSLTAYATGDAGRARLEAAAVYEALAELGIALDQNEQRYETVGRRVRFAAEILAGRRATGLELCLLYAACLESVGLDPIVALFEGRSLAGVWLDGECFTENVIDDVTFLSKKSADGIAALAILDPAAIAAENKTNFDDAADLAAELVVRERDAFQFAVDVRRCRAAGIRPLPSRTLTRAGYEVVEEETRKKPDEPRAVTQKKLAKLEEDSRTAKRRGWERKLLDLSLKNLLLNMRVTLNTIPLVVSDVAAVEDALADGTEFTVLPTAPEWRRDTLDVSPFELGGALPFASALALDFKQHIFRADLEAEELDKHLTGVYRAARQSIEENGANTLYLALGYLRWYENPKSVKARYAPLVLLPLEMVRRSAKKGYVVRMRDDEAMVNVTLLEMLKQDFKKDIAGLDPLPKDEKNIDMKLVFSVFRDAVLDMPRWDVVECASIGIFSFNKFIMWQSLRNIDKRENVSPVARALEAGTPLGNILKRSAEEEDVEAVCDREDILLPADADASQVSAVIASDRGDSFVLHGPPGTGKSQTITNIIANALYKGRRVLFVAEKMAALEVVQRRLERMGLGAFCLELHSHKANKSAMLEQFKRAVDTARSVSEEDLTKADKKLDELKAELSYYVDRLYRPYPFGITLHDAVDRYFDLSGVPEGMPFDPKRFAHLTESDVAALRGAVDELVVTARTVGHPHGHPLALVTNSAYSVSMKTDAELSVTVLSKLAKEIATLHREVDKALAGILPAASRAEAAAARKIVSLIPRCAKISDSMLHQTDLELSLRLLKKIVESKRRELELKGPLLEKYNSGIYDLPAKELLNKYHAAAGKWLLARKAGQGSVRKALKKLVKSGQTVRASEVDRDLIVIDELQKQTRFLNENFSVAVIMLGNLYRHDLTDWESVTRLVDDTMELYRALRAASGSHEGAMGQLARVPALCGKAEYAKLFGLYEAKCASLSAEEANLSRLLGIDFSAVPALSGGSYYDALAQVSAGWQRRLGDLREWCAYLKQCERAAELGLEGVVRLYGERDVPHEDVRPMFDKALAKSCILYILSREEGLNTFSSELFKARVRAYRDAAARYQLLSREIIYSRLAEKLPNFDVEANTASELGVLQRAMKNGGRGITIRKLFSEMPNLIPRLAPCMLMSPISVAQYIDPEKADFDLVIFDEASQMPTYEAVVPLAIAKQIVVVGDPKQLPPTTFFMNSFEEEEDFFGDDLESVLDDLLALGLEERHLLWHYRSRHESLIAFSNQHYYDGKLMTFPSPNDLVSNVRFIKTEGVYERGGTKRNVAEAQAVVAEVVRRLRSQEGRSLGIVTFSSVQQNLIEDLLQAEFRRYPALEQKAYAGAEPLFIKNLENVQGDERDVIIFSIGYGKDAGGRLSLNFGPLNREGGYRRLNVAVSRAKYEMLVFSSIDPEDINAARTNAVGVVNLKAFLEYAKYGRNSLASTSLLPGETGEGAGIAGDIARELKKRGYKVRTNVGASNYKVDIAVVDPKNGGAYVLGIMLDGETYRSFRATKDRELSQYQILQGLGWNLLRVWTLDYLDNKEKVIAAIVSRIGEILSGAYRPAAEAAATQTIARENTKRGKPTSKKQVYRVTALAVSPAARFSEPSAQDALAGQMKRVIEEEAPISKNLLFRRVMAANSLPRLTPKVAARLEETLASLGAYATEFMGVPFYWKDRAQAEGYEAYRVMPPGAEKRAAQDVPYEELRAAFTEILRDQVSLYRQDLIRETCRTLEYARGGEALRAAVEAALDRAAQEKLVREEDGRVKLFES